MRAIARRAVIGAAFAGVLGVYAALAAHYHGASAMAPDESFYSVAAREAVDGRLPYRDFAYTQMPLLPYVNGALLAIAGRTLAAHRAINAVWGAFTVAAVLWIVRRRTGAIAPALLAGFLVAASPRWVSVQALAVWCAPTGAFLTIALGAALHRGSYWPRAAVFAVAAAIACGCRLTSAPIVAVMALLFALEGDARRRLATAALFVGVPLAAIAPFALAAPASFAFDVVRYHLGGAHERDLYVRAAQWWNVAPAVTAGFAALLFAIPRLLRERASVELVLLATGAVALLLPMAPPSAWGVYISASVPVAAAGGAIVLHGLAESRATIARVAWALPALSLCILSPPVATAAHPPDEVAEMAAFVRAKVPPGPLLTPLGVVAVEAGRRVLPGTEMGTFAAMAPADSAAAHARGFTVVPDLTAAVTRREPVAVLRISAPRSSLSWNFGWAVPSMEQQPRMMIDAFDAAIRACYAPAKSTATMELLVRKPKCDPRGAAAGGAR
jgi:hypothetical protein